MPLGSGLFVLLIAIMVPSPATKWLRDLNGYDSTKKITNVLKVLDLEASN